MFKHYTVAKIIILILLLFKLECIAQIKNSRDRFNYEITKVTGDLNKDNLADKIVVTQDTLDEKAPKKE